MKKIYNILYISILATAIIACSSEDDLIEDWTETSPIPDLTDPDLKGDSGDADLSNLVVLGTSLGSGFMDGALYDVGQANSFSMLLGTQFQVTGVGGTTDFGQPEISSANGYNFLLNDGTSGRYELNTTARAPEATTGDLTSILTPWGGTTSELNNFSVPLTQAVQLITPATGGPRTDTYGGAVPAAGNPAFNPLYERFASNPSTDGTNGSSPMTDALSAGGTFFIYEAGVNDIALYAAGGGTNTIGPLTDAASFEGYVDLAIHALASAGTSLVTTPSYSVEGVVLNVPPILVFPFFQAVPYNAIPISADDAEDLNAAYASYNAGIAAALDGEVISAEEAARRTISFSESEGHAFVIEDETLTDLSGLGLPNYRMSEATDIIPLLTAAEFENGVGTSVPAVDEYVLIPSEQVEIETARATYNAHLAGAVADINASGGDVILVDIESIFEDAAGVSDGSLGIVVDGVTLAPDFSPTGIFSVDGIHPNPRGHGLVANKIIAAINTQWSADIPAIDVLDLRGVFFF